MVQANRLMKEAEERKQLEEVHHAPSLLSLSTIQIIEYIIVPLGYSKACKMILTLVWAHQGEDLLT